MVSENLQHACLVRQQLKEDFRAAEAKLKEADNTHTRYQLKIENLSTEITVRGEALETKFDCELDELTNHQILDLHQNKTIESDFNEILSKITDLSMLVCDCGGAYKDKLDSATKARDALNMKKKAYIQKLQEVVHVRDISADKLRNANTIPIKLEKFTGYDCKIDLFTFQSEFKKLVEPVI